MAKKKFTDTSSLKSIQNIQKASQDDVLSKIVVMPELKSYIPPLTDEEYSNLETSILAEGIRDKILLWNKDEKYIIIDGHNRYEIAQKHNLTFPYEIKEFADINDVKIYMVDIQTSRRNLTPNQRTYLMGLRYSATKGKSGNRYTGENKAEKLSEEFKVTDRTVRNASSFFDSVEELSDFAGEEVKQKLLTDKKVAKVDVRNLAQIAKALKESENPSEIDFARDAIKNAETPKQAISSLSPLLKEPKKKETKEATPQAPPPFDYDAYELELIQHVDKIKEFAKRGYTRNDERTKKLLSDFRLLAFKAEQAFSEE